MMSLSSRPSTNSMTMNGSCDSCHRRVDDGLFAGVEDAHDGGVRHPRGGLRLLTEAHAERGVGRELRLQQLDRDLAPEAGVGADVHVGHAAAPDEVADAVATREQADCPAQSPSRRRPAPAVCAQLRTSRVSWV